MCALEFDLYLTRKYYNDTSLSQGVCYELKQINLSGGITHMKVRNVCAAKNRINGYMWFPVVKFGFPDIQGGGGNSTKYFYYLVRTFSGFIYIRKQVITFI